MIDTKHIFSSGKVVFNPIEVYPGVNFVRANLGPLVEYSKTKIPKEDWQYFSDWGRIVKNPKKASGWLTMWAEASRQGLYGFLGVDYSSQIKSIRQQYLEGAEEILYGGITVEMMFFGNGITNASLAELEIILRQALPGTDFISVNGDSEFNGKKFKGENAEHLVWKAIENSRRHKRPIIILGVNMPSRSFSIWPIQHLHLCMDGGAEWSVAQKLARGLTRAPEKYNKETFIIDWSFDPNRSSVDELLLSTAYDISRRENIDIQKALIKVLNTLNIFELKPHDPIKWDRATYLKQILESNTVARVLGHSIIRDKWRELPDDIIKEILSCDIIRGKKLAKVFSGKNKLLKNNNGTQSASGNESDDDALKKAVMEVLEEVIRRLPTVASGCNINKLDKMFDVFKNNPEMALEAEKFSILKTETLKKLFDLKILNSDHVDIKLLT